MIDWPEIVRLAHEAAWGGLSDTEKAEIHRRVGELLCERGGVEWVQQLMETNRRLLAQVKLDEPTPR